MFILKNEAKEELFRAITIKDERDIFFIGGSLVEGYGNDSSDLDVFILCENPSLYNNNALYGNVPIISFIGEEYRYDIEIWEKNIVEDLIEKLNKYYSPKKDYRYFFTDQSYELLHNISIGIPIINEIKFNSLQNLIDKQRLRDSNLAVRLSKYNNELEDLEGCYKSRCKKSILLLTRRLLNTAMHALVCYYGDTNNKEKWLSIKIDRYVKDKDLVDKYWQLIIQPIDIDKDLENYMNDVLMYTNETIFRIQNKEL